MFERFTDEARRAVVLAQQEARLLDHEAIGAEHLLLGLLADDEGVVARAMAPRATLTAVRQQVEALVGRGQTAPAGDLPFAPSAKTALEGSLREARETGHEHIGTGHLMLGLLRQPDSMAGRIVEALGVDADAVRPAIVDGLASEGGPASGIRSWTGSDTMSRRMARARERIQAERDRAAEEGPGAWDVLAHVGEEALQVLGAARRHTAHGLRGELATVDLVVGVLAVGDPTVSEALAEAGVADPSPGRLAPGYREGAGGADIVVALSGQARRACSMAVRLVADEGTCVTPTHLLLAGVEMLGPVRSAIAAERLGADEAALRPVLLRRIVGLPAGPATTLADGIAPAAGAMFDRFSDQARRAVVRAQDEAARLGHANIGTEHLLLGVLSGGDGVAARALAELGVTLAAVRERVEELMGRGESSRDTGIPFTPRARNVLELSLREALQLHQSVIGTEHLLLGLTCDGEAVAARVLDRLGIDLARVRGQVLQGLEGRTAGPAADPEPHGRADQDVGWALLARGEEATWRALLRAREEAAGREQAAVGPGDIVVGILHAGDALVADALAAAGGDATALGDAGDARREDPPALPLSAAARDACGRAVGRAGEGASTILPAHLLLGCLDARDPGDVDAVTAGLGVERGRLIEHLCQRL